jgi:DnaK suppressor protein
MTEQKMNEMKQIILDRIENLESSLEYLKDETKVIAPNISLGRLTRMDAIGTKAVNEHVLSLNRMDLVRLQNALIRIEKGIYGTCITCGKEIPFGRLQHVPQALMCVPCSEKGQKTRH